jgi:hypothetical protein
LAVLLSVAVYGVIVQHRVAPPPRDSTKSIGDSQLQLRTIERIRRGEDYYAAVGDELRKNRYPTSPIINWRTPLHYAAVAALGVERAGALLLALCIAAVITAALAYSTDSSAKAVGAGLLVLGSLGPTMLVRPGAVGYGEHWSAVFIALSLNAYVAKRFATGAVLGVVAVFLRELAAPYALACGLLALHRRRKSESWIWIAGGILYLVYFAAHATAATAAVQAGDLVREESYMRWLGLSFVFMTLYANGILTLLPPVVTPIGASVGLASAWSASASTHTIISLLVYFALFLVIGQPFNFYWGYLTSPIWGHAFVHAPEGLWKLVRTALQRKSSTEQQQLAPP